MKRGGWIWAAALAGVVGLLACPSTLAWILATTREHPYAMGFAKFAVLATMGELLSRRLVSGGWALPPGPVYRFLVWGLLGVVMAAVFPLFDVGVRGLINRGLLPVGGGPLAVRVTTAVWISAAMQFIWAPLLMLYHRLTDTYLDLAGGRLARLGSVRLAQVVEAIDWSAFLGFVVFKTVPLFWLPMHAITFLLPAELRVLFAAFLSLALGAILAFSRRRTGAAPLGEGIPALLR